MEPVEVKGRTCLHSDDLVMLGVLVSKGLQEGSSQLGCSQSKSAECRCHEGLCQAAI